MGQSKKTERSHLSGRTRGVGAAVVSSLEQCLEVEGIDGV